MQETPGCEEIVFIRPHCRLPDPLSAGTRQCAGALISMLAASRFFDWLDQAMERYGITDREYLDHILPRIHDAHLWNIEIAEHEIRLYRERRSNAAKSEE